MALVTVGRIVVLLAFAVYVAGVSPHLVHHAFDHDDVQTTCAFAAAAERQQAAPVLVTALLPALAVQAVATPTPEPIPLDRGCLSIDVRGPPAAS